MNSLVVKAAGKEGGFGRNAETLVRTDSMIDLCKDDEGVVDADTLDRQE